MDTRNTEENQKKTQTQNSDDECANFGYIIIYL